MAAFPLVPLPREFSGTETQMMGQSSFLGTDSPLSHSRPGAPPAYLGCSPAGEARPREVSEAPADPFGNLQHDQALPGSVFLFIFGCQRLWVPGPGLSPGDRQATRPQERVGEPSLQSPHTAWGSEVNWFQVARPAATQPQLWATLWRGGSTGAARSTTILGSTEVNPSSGIIPICGSSRRSKQRLHYKKCVKIRNYFMACLFPPSNLDFF